MNRLIRLPTLALCLTIAFCESVNAGQLYHLTPLGFLPGFSGNLDSRAYAINTEGEIAGFGGTQTPAAIYQSFSWSNGVMSPIGKTLGLDQIGGFAINDVGQIVGVNSSQHAYITTSGGTQDLGTLGGAWSGANGINNAGQVVGFASYSTVNPDFQDAFVWTSSGGMQILSGLPGALTNVATAINGAGEIVGYAGDSKSTALEWIGGSMQTLPSLPGQAGAAATAINSEGVVVGYSQTAEGPQFNDEAVLWTAGGAIQDLGHLAGTTSSIADGINDLGQVVGESDDNGGIPFHAFIWTSNGGIQDLATLLDSSGNGWTLVDATAINNEGDIVGYGLTPGNVTVEGFLLTPVPEPSSYVLAFVAASAMCCWNLKSRTGRRAVFLQP